jgi:DNA polymerase I-like protein with 3'-5' exonuclease and polymerase domains
MFGRVVPVVATYSPQFLVQGNIEEVDIWGNDIEKIVRIGREGWKTPELKVEVLEDVKEIEARVRELLAEGEIGVDIETTALEPDEGEIKCIGFGTREKAIVIPLRRNGRELYAGKVLEKVRKAIEKVVCSGKCVYHNGYFDTFWLEWKGFKGAKDGLLHDTMKLHHCIDAEIYHSLAYVASVYTDMPYWKDIKFDSAAEDERDTSKIDDDKLFYYNGLDVIGMMKALEGLKADAKRDGVWDLYWEKDRHIVKVLVEMRLNGLPCNNKSRNKTKKMIAQRNEELDKLMREMTGVPEFFSWTKDNWVKALLYGEKDTGYFRKAVEYIEERSSAGKRMDIKQAVEFQERVDVMKVACMRIPHGFVPGKTKAGQSGLDKVALDKLVRACVDRVVEIDGLKRGGVKQNEEKTALLETVEFLKMFNEWNYNEQMSKTFLGVKIWDDGKVRGHLNSCGTSTGRLSSQKPNMQNLPRERKEQTFSVKQAYECESGWSFVERDYVNIEVYLLGYISGCKSLIRAHKEGLNIHDMNTKLWGIKEDHPKWGTYRVCAKTHIFGTSYCGTQQGMYKKLREKEPDIPVTWEEFKFYDDNFRKTNPEIFAWQAKTKMTAINVRVIRNAVGRIRVLHGNVGDEIAREAANFQIQSLSWDIAANGLIEFYKRKKDSWKLVLNVHDSIMVMCKDGEMEECNRVLTECMEMPIKIGNEVVVFKTDAKMGRNWGLMKAV